MVSEKLCSSQAFETFTGRKTTLEAASQRETQIFSFFKPTDPLEKFLTYEKSILQQVAAQLRKTYTAKQFISLLIPQDPKEIPIEKTLYSLGYYWRK
jgi:hypothetical protein